MIQYNLTDKYNEMDDDLLFPKTANYNGWLDETPDHFKFLSLLCGSLDALVSEGFTLEDSLFEALENEYEYCGFSFERDELDDLCEVLFDLGYLE